MATTFTFNNKSTSVPGVYSKVDTSGLTQPGLTATGTIALIGTAVGGKPYTAIEGPADFVRINQVGQLKSTFKSGDLLEAAAIAFDPSSDTVVTGGAQQVIAMKMNPATAGEATLQGALGPCMQVVSQDYGEFANNIGVQVVEGSSQGNQIIITSDSITETGDNLGGAGQFSLTYNGGSHGWTSMQAGVTASGTLFADAEVEAPSLTNAVIAQPPGPGQVTLAYDPADAGLAVTVYGLGPDGAALVELVSLQGDAVTQQSFATLLGLACWAAPNQKALSAQSADGATVYITLDAGKQFAGVQPLTYAYVAQTQVSVVGSTPGDQPVMLVPQGNPTQAELLTLNGTTKVTSAGSYAQLAGIVTGGLGPQTVTVAARAVSCSTAQQATVGSIVAYFDARSVSIDGDLFGFDAELTGAVSSAPSAQLDAVAPKSCLAPANLSFGADLYALVNWVNQNSTLLTASVPKGAQGAPVPMQTPLFLSGGSEGIATFKDYQNCLNLLRDVSVDCIVNLSCDPAQAAALDAHIAYMNSPLGNNERNGFVGAQNDALTGLPTKKEFLAQAQALNTRNLSIVGQGLVRYDTSGNLTTFGPQFLAVAAAGMQAGAPIGTSLTRKFVKAVSLTAHPSWSAANDAEELIQGGCLFCRLRDGAGFQWVRDVTTFLQNDTIEYVERGVNVNLNYIAKNLRQACEFAIGQPAFAGTQAALQGVLKGASDLLLRANVMTNYQPAIVTLTNYGFDISQAVAPTRPTNFIGLTLSVISSTSTVAR